MTKNHSQSKEKNKMRVSQSTESCGIRMKGKRNADNQ